MLVCRKAAKFGVKHDTIDHKGVSMSDSNQDFDEVEKLNRRLELTTASGLRICLTHCGHYGTWRCVDHLRWLVLRNALSYNDPHQMCILELDSPSISIKLQLRTPGLIVLVRQET